MNETCKARIICNNDGMEFVIVGLEEEVGALVKQKMQELKQQFDKQNPADIERCFWHIHEVPCYVTEKFAYEF